MSVRGEGGSRKVMVAEGEIRQRENGSVGGWDGEGKW